MKMYSVGLQVRESRTTQSGKPYVHYQMKYGKQYSTAEAALQAAMPYIAKHPKQLFMLWEDDVEGPSK